MSAPPLPISRLLVAMIPAVLVLCIFARWSLSWRNSLIAVVRMLLQLGLLGYFLKFAFDESTASSVQASFVAGVICVMLFVSSWIALRVTPEGRRKLFRTVLLSVLIGGGFTLLVIVIGVVRPTPWYRPRIVIPLAGMIFSNCMNAVSLAVERYNSETKHGMEPVAARKTAFEAALIPITNSMLAVGLVSIPGMMTGQVLSGESTVSAAIYQAMVMLMMFGSAGISSAVCLRLLQGRSHEPDITESDANGQSPTENK